MVASGEWELHATNHSPPSTSQRWEFRRRIPANDWETFMLKKLLIVGLVGMAAGVVIAQEARKLDLRGDRFKPLTWEQLNPAQKTMVNDLLAGSRTSLSGPFNVLLRSPEM